MMRTRISQQIKPSHFSLWGKKTWFISGGEKKLEVVVKFVAIRYCISGR